MPHASDERKILAC